MEALMKAINDIIQERDSTISIQKWEINNLMEKIEELRNENAELRNDIEKYKENEVNMA